MKIDMSRVNLIEKDIEDWLYENPDALYGSYDIAPIENWIGRQYQLPSGVADLIGMRSDRMLVVIEVKNVPINKAAVLQVCRYAEDLKHIVGWRMGYPYKRDNGEPVIEMVLVGPSIDDQTFDEATALGIRVFRFSVQLDLTVSSVRWTQDHQEKVENRQISIASRPEWEIYGLTIDEYINQIVNQNDRDEPAELADAELDSATEDATDAYLDEIFGPKTSDNGYSDIILEMPEDEE